MPKTIISDEEFAELEKAQRHDEILDAVRSLKPSDYSADFERLSNLVSGYSKSLATALKQKDVSTDLAPFIAELKPILAQLQELKGILSKPKSFRVVRGKLGLIERIVVE